MSKLIKSLIIAYLTQKITEYVLNMDWSAKSKRKSPQPPEDAASGKLTPEY